MAAETGFLIDGTVYEMPSLDSLNTDEEEVLYERCGIVQEDFVREDGESDDDYDKRTAKLTRRPGFWTSLMQIAYQRGNPAVKPDQVRLVIGKTKRMEAFSTLAADEQEDETVPLESTSEPSESSSSSSLGSDNLTRLSPASSGSDATNGSGEADAAPASTGTTRSDTSSTSDQASSAA